MTDRLDLTRHARARRQAAWAAGHDHAARLDKAGHFAPPEEWGKYEKYLFLRGVADYCNALGRDLAGLDARPAPPAVALEGR